MTWGTPDPPARPVYRASIAHAHEARPLADDYYLIAHDEHVQKCRGTPAAVGLGLAAGLVGELVLAGHLAVAYGGLYVVQAPGHGEYRPPLGGLLSEVLALVGDPAQSRDLGTWLRFLAVDAVADVRARMTAAGVLVRVRARTLTGRRRVELVPVNSPTAAWPGIRLALAMSRREPMTAADALLAALVRATGLLGHVLTDPVHEPRRAYADQLKTLLPAPLAALAAMTEVAVGDAVLTPGT